VGVSIAAGKSLTLNDTVTLPADLSGGQYTLVVTVGSALSTAESNIGDNTAVLSKAFTVAGCPPVGSAWHHFRTVGGGPLGRVPVRLRETSLRCSRHSNLRQ
jgi:hypothetical protein